MTPPPHPATPTGKTPSASGSLPEALRLGTRDLHRATERTPFMQAMLRGHVDRAAYCLFLRSLHTIYEALEAGLARHAALPALLPLRLPGLVRLDSVATDLAVLHGERWREQLRPAGAALAYAGHLHRLADHDPILLLAHAYVRYLGDLSGGQLLLGIVARALQLPGAAGTQFYRFAEPGAGEMAVAFRLGLAAVEVDAATFNRIVDEARAAFERHVKLFQELSQAETAGAS